MSGLSLIGGASRNGLIANASSADSGAADEVAQGQDFASMMGAGQHAAQAPKAPATSQPKERPQARQPDPDAQAPDTGDAASQAKAGAEEGATAQAGEAASTQARPSTAKTAPPKDEAASTDDQDDVWPPAGLGGFGLNLLPLASAAPNALAAPLTTGGLAIGNGSAPGAQPLTSLVAGLAAGAAQAQADGTAATQGAGSAPTAAAGAQAATGFNALLAQSAAHATPANGDAAAAMAVAALANPAGGSTHEDGAGTDTTGLDPINLLGTTLPQSLVRDASATSSTPFTGSPTPTPDLHADNFDDAMGARMSWLADQKIGHAHIKLSPADLGPVEVRLHLSGDQVNAAFSSNHAEVRHALESSLPRLREMLGQQGFQLGQADVGQHQQQSSQGTAGGGASMTGEPAEDALAPVGIPSTVLRQRGLLDAYA